MKALQIYFDLFINNNLNLILILLLKWLLSQKKIQILINFFVNKKVFLFTYIIMRIIKFFKDLE